MEMHKGLWTTLPSPGADFCGPSDASEREPEEVISHIIVLLFVPPDGNRRRRSRFALLIAPLSVSPKRKEAKANCRKKKRPRKVDRESGCATDQVVM
mmetsp:Transcript_48672/g.96051  ORF Transcript_48672/g.96051 Transcript_48672/m.96051 type:complete len:97 (-) Transcript_48672:543-833(-)